MIEFLEKHLVIPNDYRPLLSKSISTFSFKTIWSSIFGISFNSDDVVPHNHKVGEEKKERIQVQERKKNNGTIEECNHILFFPNDSNVIGLDQNAILKHEWHIDSPVFFHLKRTVWFAFLKKGTYETFPEPSKIGTQEPFSCFC